MKYELEQIIYYMRDNRPHSAPIVSRMQIENLHQDLACTKEQKTLFMPFGYSGVFYSTCHGIVNESEAFATKDDMVKAICST